MSSENGSLFRDKVEYTVQELMLIRLVEYLVPGVTLTVLCACVRKQAEKYSVDKFESQRLFVSGDFEKTFMEDVLYSRETILVYVTTFELLVKVIFLTDQEDQNMKRCKMILSRYATGMCICELLYKILVTGLAFLMNDYVLSKEDVVVLLSGVLFVKNGEEKIEAVNERFFEYLESVFRQQVVDFLVSKNSQGVPIKSPSGNKYRTLAYDIEYGCLRSECNCTYTNLSVFLRGNIKANLFEVVIDGIVSGNEDEATQIRILMAEGIIPSEKMCCGKSNAKYNRLDDDGSVFRG